MQVKAIILLSMMLIKASQNSLNDEPWCKSYMHQQTKRWVDDKLLTFININLQIYDWIYDKYSNHKGQKWPITLKSLRTSHLGQ
jgi:hypothetical protein